MCNSRYGDFENSFIAIFHARALVYQLRRMLSKGYDKIKWASGFSKYQNYCSKNSYGNMESTLKNLTEC